MSPSGRHGKWAFALKFVFSIANHLSLLFFVYLSNRTLWTSLTMRKKKTASKLKKYDFSIHFSLKWKHQHSRAFSNHKPHISMFLSSLPPFSTKIFIAISFPCLIFYFLPFFEFILDSPLSQLRANVNCLLVSVVKS